MFRPAKGKDDGWYDVGRIIREMKKPQASSDHISNPRLANARKAMPISERITIISQSELSLPPRPTSKGLRNFCKSIDKASKTSRRSLKKTLEI